MSARGTVAAETSISTENTRYSRAGKPAPAGRPRNGLLLRVDQRRTLRDEILCHLMERVLIGGVRWDRMLDKPALMKLLPVCQYVVGKRYPDRAPGIARRID